MSKLGHVDEEKGQALLFDGGIPASDLARIRSKLPQGSGASGRSFGFHCSAEQFARMECIR
jgi:hypothetical protein